ncbi:MAG: hypothetical protein AAF740_14105 [Bacteroidota bacterium]
MKHLQQTLIFFFVAFLTIGIQAQDRLPTYFYKKLIGKSGELTVELDLIRTGSEALGFFVQEGNTTQRGTLEGVFLRNGTFSLEEIVVNDPTDAEDDKIIATLLISPRLDGTFEVMYTSQETGKTLEFILKENYPKGSAPIRLIHEGRSYAGRAEVDLVYAKLIHNENALQKNVKPINSYISSHILNYDHPNSKVSNFEDHSAFLENFVSRYKQMEVQFKGDHDDLPYWENVHHLLVVTNKNNIVSFKFSELIEEGSAHSTEKINYINFDLRTGKPLKLEEVMKSGYKEALKKLGEEAFRAHYGFADIESFREEGINFPKDKFILSDNYVFRNNGI